jgi:hypothetical protein
MMNYKPIAIVAKKGCAVVMNQNKKYARITAKTNMIASLEALKAVLSKIPTNEEWLLDEPRLILLWSKSPIVGFATGAYIDYLRTNHTVSGIPFTEEEMTLIRECAVLLAERNLNICIRSDRFISNNKYRDLIDAAWTTINKCISTNDKTQRLYEALDRVNNKRNIENNSSCEGNSTPLCDFLYDKNTVQKIKMRRNKKITAVEKTKNKNFAKFKNKNSQSNSVIFAKSNWISGPFSSWQLLVEANREAANEMSEDITNNYGAKRDVRRLYNSCREHVS